MKESVEKLIYFQGGSAEVLLPKNATDISVRIKNSSNAYLCALVDPNEKEREKYLIRSFDEPQQEQDLKLLKKVYHLVCGTLYWYYTKV